MARRTRRYHGLPLKRLQKLVTLLNSPLPESLKDRLLHFQAIRVAASKMQSTGDLGLLEQLTPVQRRKLKIANDAQRTELDLLQSS